ncbi:MAG: hypothetical protein ACKVWR_03675 [Acidimicrobiales bacterium]
MIARAGRPEQEQSPQSGALGVYPGSFNPPTLAHLEIAAAARDKHGLVRVDLAVSRVALAKETVSRPLFEHRMEVLDALAAARPWLGLVVTDAQLLVDIAAGYDVLVMGADKWGQVIDPVFYAGDPLARDAAVARLPTLAIAPRPPHPAPAEHLLAVGEHVVEMSSTAVRAGRREWMAPEAAAFDRRTGAWTEPERYERWLGSDAGRVRR